MAMFARPYTPSTTHSIGGEGQRPDYAETSLACQINITVVYRVNNKCGRGSYALHACMRR